MISELIEFVKGHISISTLMLNPLIIAIPIIQNGTYINYSVSKELEVLLFVSIIGVLGLK